MSFSNHYKLLQRIEIVRGNIDIRIPPNVKIYVNTPLGNTWIEVSDNKVKVIDRYQRRILLWIDDMTTKEGFEIHPKGIIIDVINTETNHFLIRGVLQGDNWSSHIIANSFAEILHISLWIN